MSKKDTERLWDIINSNFVVHWETKEAKTIIEKIDKEHVELQSSCDAVCEWKQHSEHGIAYMATVCGQRIYWAGKHDYRYCPWCGKTIKVKK